MALYNEFTKAGISRPVATVVTQVEVDPNDPSFAAPSKPIGTFMTKEDAEFHRDTDGWSIVEDSGRGYRRVVPSPVPKNIIELETVKTLLDSGVIVIAAGGGGIPVTVSDDGLLHGAEAVIDKDLAASLMARELGADLFVISTAVEQVCLNFGKANQVSLGTVTIDEVKTYMEQGHFAPGSMLPKVESIINFVKATGRDGIITSLDKVQEALEGKTGTRIVLKK
jgi:carbamate kinase